MGKFKMIGTLKSVLVENQISSRMYCSSYEDETKRRFCGRIESFLLSDAKKGKYSKYKNRLLKRLEKIYESFQIQNNKLDVIFDNILNHKKLFDEKISLLVKFIDDLHPGCKLLKTKAVEDLDKFRNAGKKMLLYKKKVEQSEIMSYSFLNRLNTNYSALAILLTDISDSIGGIEKKPEDYLEHFLNNETVNSLIIDLLGKPNETIQTILNTITETRKKGNYSEDEYKKYLTTEGIVFEDFSDDFGLVDFLGVDLLVKYPEQGYFSPVQVKSAPMNFDQVKISDYEETNCKCFLIYPNEDKTGWEKIGSNGDTISFEPGSEQIINCKSVKTKTFSDGKTWVYCNPPFSPKPDKNVEFITFKDVSGQTGTVRSQLVRSAKSYPYGIGGEIV